MFNIPFYSVSVSGWTNPQQNKSHLIMDYYPQQCRYQLVHHYYPQQAAEYLNNKLERFKANNQVVEPYNDGYKVIPNGCKDPIVLHKHFDTEAFKTRYPLYWHKYTAKHNLEGIFSEALNNNECICIDSLKNKGLTTNAALINNENNVKQNKDIVTIKLGDLLHKVVTSNIFIANTCDNLHIFALGETQYNTQQILNRLENSYLETSVILTLDRCKYLIVIEYEDYTLLSEAYRACFGKIYNFTELNLKYATIDWIKIT